MSGGELSQGMTQGYGPERYSIAKAKKGAYRVIVHNYGTNRNLLGAETHVNVVVTRHALPGGVLSRRASAMRQAIETLP